MNVIVVALFVVSVTILPGKAVRVICCSVALSVTALNKKAMESTEFAWLMLCCGF